MYLFSFPHRTVSPGWQWHVAGRRGAWLEVIALIASIRGGCHPFCVVECLVEAKRTARAMYLAYAYG